MERTTWDECNLLQQLSPQDLFFGILFVAHAKDGHHLGLVQLVNETCHGVKNHGFLSVAKRIIFYTRETKNTKVLRFGGQLLFTVKHMPLLLLLLELSYNIS